MATTRVYVVTENDNTTAAPRLIRATFRATAVRHAAQSRYKARIATHDDLEKLITAGIRVEQAAEPVSDAQAEGGAPLHADV